jgi:hypothetical protein
VELNNGCEQSETPELWSANAAPNVPRLIRPMLRSKKKVEKPLLMVNIKETRRNKGIKKMQDRIRQCIITKFIMQLDQSRENID